MAATTMWLWLPRQDTGDDKITLTEYMKATSQSTFNPNPSQVSSPSYLGYNNNSIKKNGDEGGNISVCSIDESRKGGGRCYNTILDHLKLSWVRGTWLEHSFMDSSHSSARSSVSQNSVSSDVADESCVPSGSSFNALTEEIVAYEKESDETHAVK
ncbi:hypothetical protein Tco_0047730, partial [Tanacetum coccineum]